MLLLLSLPSEQDLFQYTCNWNNSFGMVVEILLFSEYGNIQIANNHLKILNRKNEWIP